MYTYKARSRAEVQEVKKNWKVMRVLSMRPTTIVIVTLGGALSTILGEPFGKLSFRYLDCEFFFLINSVNLLGIGEKIIPRDN